MTDIQLIEFSTISGFSGAYIILVQNSGEGAKMRPDTFLSLMTASLRPSIDANGFWKIGSENTGVPAKGKTPELGKNGSVIFWNYEGESQERILADLKDYVFKFSDLTPTEIDRLCLHYEQLTPSQIAELQKPATDKAAEVQIAEDLRVIAENERVTAEENRAQAEETRENQEEERQTNTATAISNADAARDKAEEVAAHPTYVGQDFYIYEYDLATHQYNKTEKLVKAAGFAIDYNFSSMSELLANQPTGKGDGLLAIINTQDTEDEDNAKLFISKSGRWQYVVDMSGFRGFQGYTPQLSVGNIVVGDNRSDASVTLSENGRDTKNNPKFKVNFRIPAFAFSDFTNDDILLLQKPAIDKAAEIQVAEDQRVIAENKRAEEEKKRAEAEIARIDHEVDRIEKEGERLSAESERKSSELLRNNAENGRIATEQERNTAEVKRDESEQKREGQEKTRQTAEGVRIDNEQTRIFQEGDRQIAEGERAEAEQTRITQEAERVKEEKRRVIEVDNLISRLQNFEVTGFEQRLHYLEMNASCVGKVVGYDDEIDENVFINS